MPLTRIPERHEAGLATIASIRDDQQKLSRLTEAIISAPPVSEISDFTDSVQARLSDWRRSDVLNVIRTLYSLTRYIAEEELTPQDLSKQVFDVMRASGKERLSVPDEAKQQFLKALTQLLAVESIRLAAKAYGLRYDHERRFCDVKVVTDMRPVFADVHQKPTRIIVGHTLKLGYHENGEHKEFYVALDGSDVAALKTALQRAEDKESSLRTLMADTGLKEVDHF
jgi:hypothetical protein